MSEDRDEWAARNMQELLQELRVAQTGAQVLFAFLLTVPFQQAFHLVSTFERNIYHATLLAAALSVVLFIAPAARHRMLLGKQDEAQLLSRFNRHATLSPLRLRAVQGGAPAWCWRTG